MELALDGIAAYKNWTEYTQLKDPQAEFTHTGALWMLGKTKEENVQMAERLEQFGVGSEVMDAAAVEQRWKVLKTDPMPTYDENTGEEIPFEGGEFSAVYEDGCGHMDSNACLNDMKTVLDNHSIPVHFNSKVSKFSKTSDGSKVTGVVLESGESISAGTVINCAGPWFEKLNAPANITCSTSMLPTRIQVGHKHVTGDFLDLPFVADSWGNSGVYFMPRAQNKQLVFGSIAHRFESEIVDPDDYNTSLDPGVKQDYLNCLFHRMPSLPRSGEIHGFSHMYT
ncbi:hypothetical protein TrRE_jg7436, partial [Triparma retinervis]